MKFTLFALMLICIWNYNSYGAVFKGSFMERIKARDWDDCKEKFESCRAWPKCCGELHCYREGGVKPWNTEGTCVECIDRTLACQTDAQCCDNLMCQKDTIYDVNGVCDILRNAGEPCHEDNQCVSGDCDRDWHELSGTCN